MSAVSTLWRLISKRVVYRNAQTGEWVSAAYAKAHPDVTTRETVKRWTRAN